MFCEELELGPFRGMSNLDHEKRGVQREGWLRYCDVPLSYQCHVREFQGVGNEWGYVLERALNSE